MVFIRHFFSFYVAMFILVLVMGSFDLAAQNQHKVDSLQELLNKAVVDTAIINLYLELGDCYRSVDYDSAFQLYSIGRAYSQKINRKDYEANCVNRMGNMNLRKGKYKVAEEYYKTSVELSEQLNDDAGAAMSLNNIGILHYYQGENDDAIEYYIRALEKYENIKNKRGMAYSYNNIGAIYLSQDKYDKALEYFKNSCTLREELNDREGASDCYNNIGIVYKIKGDYSLAIDYYKKTNQIASELGDIRGVSASFTNIGLAFLALNEYEEAYQNISKALNADLNVNDFKGIAEDYLNFTRLYLKMGKLDSAIICANRGLNIALDLKLLPVQQHFYEKLSELGQLTGNYLMAYENHVLYKSASDSLFNNESSEKIAEITTRYETARIDRENEILRNERELQSIIIEKQDHQRNFILILTALLILSGVFYFSRFWIKKQANLKLTEKNQLISKQKEELSEALKNLKALNNELQNHKNNLEQMVKERVKELETKNAELENYNNLFVGREFRIKELRDQVKMLKEQLGRRNNL